MDGVSPGSWSETDFAPVEGDAAHRLRPACPATASAWIDALPHPAALVTCVGNGITFDLWNDRFGRSFGALTAPSGDNGESWTAEFREEIRAFAGSSLDQRRFEIERQGQLGTEAFACSLARVAGEGCAADCVLVSAIDRTADRKIEENLRRELVSDTLTALPNRIGFGEAIETLLERAGLSADTQVAVLIVDLMRFSRINEALGTMAGDELILAVAARLKGCLGNDVALARIGGNEFGLCQVAPRGAADAASLADRVRKTISAPIRLSNLEISISCAIGCSIATVADADADELVRQAQTSARLAKRTDRLEIYQPGELGAARQRFFLETRLRDVLANCGLHLQYQPIIDLRSDSLVGFEALARWNDPDLGAISPNDFIPVAEESGLIVQLGRWALNQAMQQLAQWDATAGERVPLKVNVNLSPIQVVRDDVVALIGDVLRTTGVDGGRLMVELTESAIVADPESCRTLLDALKRFDVAIAMDDFGTGYSNMASLQSLPIDLLKIDRSFVSDMLVDQDKLAIVHAILSLAEALGMHTTAEGIEDAEVAAKLSEMGCTFGQGYYYARPMTADEAYTYWRSRRKSAT